jgi:D-arabinose 1-dehydrogenase-like Zn-dependent alcohol dehydrogenase
MRAWQLVEHNHPLVLNEVPDPEPGPDEVVIDIRATGLCHSDVSYIDGSLNDLLTPVRPITLGHEPVGVVSAVGSKITKFKVGDRVGAPAAPDSPGTGIPGGFSDKLLVPERLVISIPDGISWVQAATAMDAGMTSYHALVKRGGLKPGMKAGIIGFGGLGSLAAQVGLGIGAQIFVAEINEAVHEYARSVGVTGLSTSITDFEDEQLDVIVDYAGFGVTTADAIQTVKPGAKRLAESSERPGGRVVQVGLPAMTGEINLHTLTLNEVELFGSMGGTPEDCSEYLDLVAAGKARSRVTEIGFADIGAGIGRLERGEVIGRLVAVL